MPWMENSTYTAPPLFANGHLQTLYPYFFRKIRDVNYSRVRLNTSDGDFIDVDRSSVDSPNVIIISHGLEGSSDSQYIKGMTRIFNKQGLDVIAWNQRSCSGELNRLKRFYHSGVTDDLEFIIKYTESLGYKNISLMGFSLGGNLTALYLGQQGKNLSPRISNAVLFSVPCDLGKSAEKISQVQYRFYLESFLTTMRQKILKKNLTVDLGVDTNGIEKIKSFGEFDDRFTAPLHGFKSAQEYYQTCSSKNWLQEIAVPTLIVNAKDDPFLTKECFPIREARKNKNLFLETPKSGGHVGFVTFNQGENYWSEKRAQEFLGQTA